MAIHAVNIEEIPWMACCVAGALVKAGNAGRTAPGPWILRFAQMIVAIICAEVPSLET